MTTARSDKKWESSSVAGYTGSLTSEEVTRRDGL